MLNLAELGLTEKCVEIISEIVKLSDVFVLNLSGNTLGDVGVLHLAPELSKT